MAGMGIVASFGGSGLGAWCPALDWQAALRELVDRFLAV